MTEHTKENISSLMDGELDTFSCTKLIDNDELKACWHRYHLISDIMHQRLPLHSQALLTEKISESIKQEPSILAPIKNKSIPTYFKPIAGLALAASVATIAVLGIQNYANTELQPQQQTAQVQQTLGNPTNLQFGVPVSLPDPQAVQPVQLKIQSDPRISRYVLDHNEYQLRVGQPGVVPVSIFIEKLSTDVPVNSRSMNMDGVNVYSRTFNGVQVTAVGEVSDPTVRQIVDSVIETR